MRFNIPRPYRQRWFAAIWGVHVIGISIAVVTVSAELSWWNVFALFVMYLTGFGAAVLVEIATQ